MLTHFIIATDSRGRGLEHYISTNFPMWDFTVIVIPGGQIQDLEKEIINNIHSEKKNIVTLYAGICNLTEKINHAVGSEIMYSTCRVGEFLSSLDSLNRFLRSKNVILKIASVPPVSIFKYQHFQKQRKLNFRSTLCDFDAFQQQKKLEEDIRYINTKICLLNEANNVKNIHLDKDLIKITVKHRGRTGQNRKKISKFVYNKLYDGVHPEFSLKMRWFDIICKSIQSDFNFDDVLFDTDSSEDETETWDFKRVTL